MEIAMTEDLAKLYDEIVSGCIDNYLELSDDSYISAAKTLAQGGYIKIMSHEEKPLLVDITQGGEEFLKSGGFAKMYNDAVVAREEKRKKERREKLTIAISVISALTALSVLLIGILCR